MWVELTLIPILPSLFPVWTERCPGPDKRGKSITNSSGKVYFPSTAPPSPRAPPCSCLFCSGRNAVKPKCLHMWICNINTHSYRCQVCLLSISMHPRFLLSRMETGLNVSTIHHVIILSSHSGEMHTGNAVSYPEQRKLRTKSARKEKHPVLELV